MTSFPMLRFKQCLSAVCFILSLFIYSSASAQRTRGSNADGDVLSGSNSSSGGYFRKDGWALGFSGGYESPLGDVKSSYQGSPTFGVVVTRRAGNVIFSGTVDYRSYKPKDDAEISSDDGVNFYTSTFSKYRGIGLLLGVSYELPITDGMGVYGGVNGGTMLVSYDIDVESADVSASVSVSNTQVTYIGPKIGLNFMLSPSLNLGLEGRYSLGTIGVSGSYNSRDGGSSSATKGFNSYGGGVILSFSF